MADFYMSEMIDNGAGALSSGSTTLFVFNDTTALLEHFAREGIETSLSLDGEEAVTAFVDRLGVDSCHLWVVRNAEVVERLDWDTFWEITDGAQTVAVDRRREVEALAANSDSLAVKLRVSALEAALPASEAPLAAGAWSALRWSIDKKDSRVGERVKLGFIELTGDFFWA